MPVPEDVAMKTDSRCVMLGDWVFFTGWGDLEQITTQGRLTEVKVLLDYVNPKVDRYGMVPKVFPSSSAAKSYNDDHREQLMPRHPHFGNKSVRGGYDGTT